MPLENQTDMESSIKCWIGSKFKITAIGTQQYDVVQRVVNYKDGQVLETLAGIADGRSVIVSSGKLYIRKRYNIPRLTTTYALISGSNVNYKPPLV